MSSKFLGPVMVLVQSDVKAAGHGPRFLLDPTYWKEEGEPEVLTFSDGLQIRVIGVKDVEFVDENFTASRTDSDATITVRPVTSTDYPDRPGPLPVDAIIASVRDGRNIPMTTAMLDDAGMVHTLLTFGDGSAWLRYNAAWHRVPETPEEDPLDDWNVVDVDDKAISMFDKFDGEGKMVHITRYPTLNKTELRPYWPPPEIDEAPAEPVPPTDEAEPADVEKAEPTEPVAAAGHVLQDHLVMDVIDPITSAADVDTAIERAVEDPSIRWYVEKRARVFGVETFPWQD